jgi:hypothetical protein
MTRAVSKPRRRKTPPSQLLTDAADLAMAIEEFERVLPGWWWSVCACSVSRDASCGPDSAGPDAALLKQRIFDEGFHCDDRNGTPAGSLRRVMQMGLRAKRGEPVRGLGRYRKVRQAILEKLLEQYLMLAKPENKVCRKSVARAVTRYEFARRRNRRKRLSATLEKTVAPLKRA